MVLTMIAGNAADHLADKIEEKTEGIIDKGTIDMVIGAVAVFHHFTKNTPVYVYTKDGFTTDTSVVDNLWSELEWNLTKS